MEYNPYEQLLKYLDVVQPRSVAEMYVAIEEHRKAFAEGTTIPTPKVCTAKFMTSEDWEALLLGLLKATKHRRK